MAEKSAGRNFTEIIIQGRRGPVTWKVSSCAGGSNDAGSILRLDIFFFFVHFFPV